MSEIDCLKVCSAIKEGKCCENRECRNWIDYPEDLNCVLVAVKKHGRMTLQETSKRLGISFVRVAQIEKKALVKLSTKIEK